MLFSRRPPFLFLLFLSPFVLTVLLLLLLFALSFPLSAGVSGGSWFQALWMSSPTSWDKFVSDMREYMTSIPFIQPPEALLKIVGLSLFPLLSSPLLSSPLLSLVSFPFVVSLLFPVSLCSFAALERLAGFTPNHDVQLSDLCLCFFVFFSSCCCLLSFVSSSSSTPCLLLLFSFLFLSCSWASGGLQAETWCAVEWFVWPSARLSVATTIGSTKVRRRTRTQHEMRMMAVCREWLDEWMNKWREWKEEDANHDV